MMNAPSSTICTCMSSPDYLAPTCYLLLPPATYLACTVIIVISHGGPWRPIAARPVPMVTRRPRVNTCVASISRQTGRSPPHLCCSTTTLDTTPSHSLTLKPRSDNNKTPSPCYWRHVPVVPTGCIPATAQHVCVVPSSTGLLTPTAPCLLLPSPLPFPSVLSRHREQCCILRPVLRLPRYKILPTWALPRRPMLSTKRYSTSRHLWHVASLTPFDRPPPQTRLMM